MKKVTVEVYELNELKDDAYRSVIEKYRTINVEFDYWFEDITKKWEAELEAMGYKSPKIYFSGFSSQGDGVCFTAESIDFRQVLMEVEKKGIAQKWGRVIKAFDEGNLEGRITHHQRYYYATSTDVEIDLLGDADWFENDCEKLYALIETHREELGNKLYKELEREYDDLTTEDAVHDTIEANDMLFTKDGRVFRA